jgi:hypothetical protein
MGILDIACLKKIGNMKTISKHKLKKWYRSDHFLNFVDYFYIEYLREKHLYNEDFETKENWFKNNKSLIYKKYKEHLKKGEKC